jgi:hypothetical protein
MGRKQISLRLDEDTWELVSEWCVDAGISVNSGVEAFLKVAIDVWMSAAKPPPGKNPDERWAAFGREIVTLARQKDAQNRTRRSASATVES